MESLSTYMRTGYKRSIIVGISGGVDSAVAAWLLQRQGWEVQGLFMKNWEEDDTHGFCAAAADLAMAQAVAKHLGIKLLTVNFASEYWEHVFSHFLAEYKAGRTPNPDILCNSEIKFRDFLDYALINGATAIATGHYAKTANACGLDAYIDPDQQRVSLLLPADKIKDQTYFLHRLNQEQLRLSRFPLEDITKTVVRQIAATIGLPNAKRQDSTGICFIGERKFREFLAHYLPPQPGPIETIDGMVIGQHQGLMYHTIGQRQGLGIGGVRGKAEAPWFVAAKDLSRNAIVVVQGANNPLLWRCDLQANAWHWISSVPPSSAVFNCQARIRHRQSLQNCEVVKLDVDKYQINFATSQWAIAPGQAVVLYLVDECIGGGVITA